MLFPSFCRILQKAGFRLKVPYLSFLKLYPLEKIETNFIFAFKIYPLYLRHCLDSRNKPESFSASGIAMKRIQQKKQVQQATCQIDTLFFSLSQKEIHKSLAYRDIVFPPKGYTDEFYCSRKFLHQVITSAAHPKSKIQ